jgi:hypothetical protein
MPNSQSVNGETRHETQLERLDRNLEELTGELNTGNRTPGHQILEAFVDRDDALRREVAIAALLAGSLCSIDPG